MRGKIANKKKTLTKPQRKKTSSLPKKEQWSAFATLLLVKLQHEIEQNQSLSLVLREKQELTSQPPASLQPQDSMLMQMVGTKEFNPPSMDELLGYLSKYEALFATILPEDGAAKEKRKRGILEDLREHLSIYKNYEPVLIECLRRPEKAQETNLVHWITKLAAYRELHWLCSLVLRFGPVFRISKEFILELNQKLANLIYALPPLEKLQRAFQKDNSGQIGDTPPEFPKFRNKEDLSEFQKAIHAFNTVRAHDYIDIILRGLSESLLRSTVDKDGTNQAAARYMPRTSSFITTEDLKELTNFKQFTQALDATDSLEKAPAIDLLCEADKFAQEVRGKIQCKIKGRLWKDEGMPGTVSFSEVVKPKTLADGTEWLYGYLKASCGNRSTNVRPLTDNELEKAIVERENFAIRVKKRSAATAKSK